MAETKPKGKNFYERLLVVMAGLDYLQKDKKNTMQGYSYLSEAKVKAEVRKLFIDNGIIFIPSFNTAREYEISPTKNGTRQFNSIASGTFKLIDAYNPEVREEGNWIGSGSDTGDKGLYKAITGGIKYVLTQMELIPSGDDPEKDEISRDEGGIIDLTPPISTAQVKQIMELLTKKTVKQSWFMEFGIENRENITSGKKTNGSIITEAEGTAIIQAMLKLEDKKTTPPVTPA